MMSMRSNRAGDAAGPPIIGWDVGGVNLKAARLVEGALAAPADRHAVTMTAGLSQYFRTKREGVGFVLDAIAAAVPGDAIHVWGTDARFHAPAGARTEPLRVAASNWMAIAALVARSVPDAILVDLGSATTAVAYLLQHALRTAPA